MRPGLSRILFPARNAETLAWRAAVIGDGGAVSNQRLLRVDKLISTLKGGGIWDKFDRLHLFDAENSQQALRDIRAAALATANGSPTFTADRGYTGVANSTTVYIDSGFNPTSGSPNYTQNSAHISMWSNTNVQSSNGGCGIGMDVVAGAQSNIFPKFSDGNMYFRINDPFAGASGGIANANSLGHYLANRSGASAQQGYRNAVDQGVVAVTSAAITNGNFGILADRDGLGSYKLGDEHQNSGVSIGGSLTPGEVVVFYNALRIEKSAAGVS